MIKERWFDNPERFYETAQALKQKFQACETTDIACDFDDTLIASRALFPPAFNQIAESFAVAGGRYRPQQVRKLIDEYLLGIRKEFGVNPALTEVAVGLVAKHLGLGPDSEIVQKAFERIHQIYTKDIPQTLDGARETIDVLNHAGVRVSLMTHAQESWTRYKITQAGFIGKFAAVCCFDVSLPKAPQWREQFAKVGIEPAKALVIGDNYHGDIVPTVSCGARGVWVTNGGREIFSVENHEGELDDFAKSRVITALSIADVPEAILKSGG